MEKGHKGTLCHLVAGAGFRLRPDVLSWSCGLCRRSRVGAAAAEPAFYAEPDSDLAQAKMKKPVPLGPAFSFLVAGAGWPSPLRGSVMSAGDAGLETNLRPYGASQVQNFLISKQKWPPRGGHSLFGSGGSLPTLFSAGYGVGYRDLNSLSATDRYFQQRPYKSLCGLLLVHPLSAIVTHRIAPASRRCAYSVRQPRQTAWPLVP